MPRPGLHCWKAALNLIRIKLILDKKRFLGNYSNYTVSAICLNRMKEVQANDVAGLIRSHKTKCELPAVDKNLQT